MNDKYELVTDDTVTAWNGATLYRLRALRDFAAVATGDLGGYIEREANLTVSGDAWVFGDARVFGGAWVFGGARVFGDARVYGDAHDHGYLYVGTLNADECEQFAQAASRQGVSAREALDWLARDYAQLHNPKVEA